jgi:hypothetical protein
MPWQGMCSIACQLCTVRLAGWHAALVMLCCVCERRHAVVVTTTVFQSVVTRHCEQWFYNYMSPDPSKSALIHDLLLLLLLLSQHLLGDL